MCALDIRPALATERLVLRAPTTADAAGMIDWAARDPRAEPGFAIEHRQFGVIGRLGFQARENGRTEVGCWLKRPFRGRGYGAEALKAALGWAREDWGKGALWAGHRADDPAAAGAFVKAGFLYTGDVERRACPRGGDPAPTRMMVWLA